MPRCRPPRRAVARAMLASLCLALALAPRAAAAQAPVGLQLVLAIDVSSSIDAEDYTLQRAGIAAALTDPVVRHALDGPGAEPMAIAVMQWAGPDQQALTIGWTRLERPADLAALAERVAAMPRRFAGGDTWIGAAIDFAAGAIAAAPLRGRRRVVDISGDGGAEGLGMTRAARDRAVARGLTVNGLPVESIVADLAAFYRAHVIGGDGAFLVRAADFRDFARAMRLKLIREIGGRPLAARGHGDPP